MAKKKFRAAIKVKPTTEAERAKAERKFKAILVAGLPMPDQFRPFGQKKKKKGKGK